MVIKHILATMGMCMATWAIGTSASAQQVSTNVVADKTDWTVFVEDDPQECWGVSAPKETVNTRDGRVVAVRRGDILLFVFYRPDADVKGQVTFTGGYPFAEGSTVNLDIGGTEFELMTVPNDPDTPSDDREWAWAVTASDDAKIVTAMKRGTQAVLTGRSARGTQTKDTFSLLGFTAAIEDAEKRCSSN